MLIRNLKIAWRHISRQKFIVVINILGLTLGLCACIVIYAITRFELSFDTFHDDKERIHRVMSDVTESTGDKLHFAKLPPAVLPDLRNNLPDLETIAGIIPFNARITIPDVDKPLKQFDSKREDVQYAGTVIAEPGYFDIFKYKWLAGDASNSLAAPFCVVLTESRAHQYFGSPPLDQIIGKQVIYQDSLKVTVTGIVKDWNENTDLSFTDFISYKTIDRSFLNNIFNTDLWKQNAMSAWVFTKLKRGMTAGQVNSKMNALVKNHTDAHFKLALWLEPISNMHFNDDIIENQIRTAHRPTLYSLIAIAIFILALAVVNFINLSLAVCMRRTKEVGVRKVLGSGKASLLFQFLLETFVITSVAVILAILLIKPVLNLFHAFIPAEISFNLLIPSTTIFILLVILVTSLLAGLYPAAVLSSLKPALSLRSGGAQIGSKSWMLRRVLIVFQFSVSLVFIIGSIVIVSQLKYTREKDPGFTSEAIITVDTPREGPVKTAILAQQIKQISGVDKVAMQWVPPMSDNPRGMKLKLKGTDEKDFWVTQVAGNEEFIPLYNIKIISGRNLVKSDSVNEFVINESLSRHIGIKNSEDAIGKILYWNDKPYPIVGVVADFHTSSLHEPITPVCIINRADRMGSLAIRLASAGKQSGTIKATLSMIEKSWKQIYPAAMFNYRFYDESLELLYEKDQRTSRLITASMAITIFISCIGLFGLALFMAEKRAKEISIRKIMGASAGNIVALLNKDFVVMIIIAFFIASPIAWYFANEWLQGFAYRINISWWMFVLAESVAITIALLTVSFQSIKAATVNPVKNLRDE